jgi:hypothetical protein
LDGLGVFCSCQALDCNNQEVDAAEKNHAVHFPPSAATPAVAEVMSPILTEHLPDDAEDVVSKILVSEKFWCQKSSGASKVLVSMHVSVIIMELLLELG